MPLHIGPRRPWGRLSGRWLAHCQGLQQGELCEREGTGKCRAPPAVAWPPRLSAERSAPASQGPRLGSAAPHTRRLTSWAPSSCLTHVVYLALSSPAETCAADSGMPLRAWAPAHSPSSGQAAPEPRSAGGAERPPRKPSEQHAGKRASLAEAEAAQPRAAKACLGRAECASSPAELQLCSEARSCRVAARDCSALGEPCPDLPHS